MSLSPQERKAIAGMSLIAIFLVASFWEIGRRNLWFESKNTYYTTVKDADGLRVGSLVTIAGLRVGEVSSLDVDEENNITVTMKVKKTVASRIREDSVATAFRAFIIGEKRIEIVPGTEHKQQLPDKAFLYGKETSDLMEFVTGKKLAEMMDQVTTLMGGLTTTVKGLEEIFGLYKGGKFDKTISLVDPALENFLKLSDDLIVMTKELKTKSKQMPALVENTAGLTGDMRADLFKNGQTKLFLTNFNSVMEPVVARTKLIDSLLANLEDLSHDLKANPQYGKQVLDAVKELTVTLKALQKTWILEDKTEEVKNEEKAKKPK